MNRTFRFCSKHRFFVSGNTDPDKELIYKATDPEVKRLFNYKSYHGDVRYTALTLEGEKCGAMIIDKIADVAVFAFATTFQKDDDLYQVMVDVTVVEGDDTEGNTNEFLARELLRLGLDEKSTAEVIKATPITSYF
jgi:hypothetical protein